jgi:hypothetical protein
MPPPATHRAPIESRHSMAQGQVKTSGFTFKEIYDLYNQQLSLLNARVASLYIGSSATARHTAP